MTKPIRWIAAVLLAVCAVLATHICASAQDDCLFETDGPHCNDGYAYNGYYAHDGVWVPGMLSVASWMTPAPTWITGSAVWYAQGVMEATAEFNGLSLEGYHDGVALISCADIGLPVWMRRPGYTWEGPYLTVDCAQQNHAWPIVASRGHVVELGYETALRWGMIVDSRTVIWNLEGIQVSKIPPEYLYGQPVDYQSWFLAMATFSPVPESRPLYRPPSSWRINGEWIRFESPDLPRQSAEPRVLPAIEPVPTPMALQLPLLTATVQVNRVVTADPNPARLLPANALQSALEQGGGIMMLGEPWDTIIIAIAIPIIVQAIKIWRDKGGREPSKYVKQGLALGLAVLFTGLAGGFAGITWPALPLWPPGDIGAFILDVLNFVGGLVYVIGLATTAVIGLYDTVLKRLLEAIGFATKRALEERVASG